MGFLDFGKAFFTSSADAHAAKQFVAEYKRLRPTRLRLNNTLTGRLSRDAIMRGAKRLGLLSGETIVFEDEDETSVLMDYCIYDVYRHGRNAVEQYLCECPPEADSDEMTYLQAMQQATYTMIVVNSVQHGVGCRVRNLFTDETRLLIDMGLSETGTPGLVMAARLLDHGGYIATTGAALPIGVLDDRALDQCQRNLPPAAPGGNFDPAPLIRKCLAHDAMSHIRYEGTDVERRGEVDESAVEFGTRPRQRRSSAKRKPTKPAGTRRCGCGSGKMFKNCCGKRSAIGN